MNNVSLVTGASRGIGKASAIKLAEEGFDIAINYNRTESGAKDAFARIKELGRNAILVKADVSDYEAVELMVKKVVDEFGKLDVLVNNAGIYPRKLVDDISPDEWQEVMDINLKGIFNCCKAVIPYMKKQRKGSIINLSSVLGIMGSKQGAHYSASKAGVIGITKSLAKELAPHNIRVNVIAPGAIETDILKKDTPEERKRRIAQIPMGRVGRPEEIAEVVVFLASEKSSYMTGETISVNGGLLMV